MQFECWREPMRDEIRAFEDNKIWKIVDPPLGAVPIERHEPQLVTKGYNQVDDMDYSNTFSPVAKMSTI